MREPFKLVALSAACFLGLCGCASPLYYWGNYDDVLYSEYSKNDKAQAFEGLSKIVSKAERGNLRVGPGIQAEYAFLLYERGDYANAIVYFQKEAAAFPESAVLMKTLVERVKQRQAKGAADVVPPAKPPSPQVATDGGAK